MGSFDGCKRKSAKADDGEPLAGQIQPAAFWL